MPYKPSTSSLRAGVFLLAILICPLASAYMVENQRGTGHFYGQFCAACWHGEIPAGESRGCPGDANGCRGETMVYLFVKKIKIPHPTSPFQQAEVFCYAGNQSPVTAHGRVVFEPVFITVYGDDGKMISRQTDSYWWIDGFGDRYPVNDCVDQK